MIKRFYNFLFRKLVVEPRIKRYLFHHLSEEDKSWLYRWHTSGDVLKKTGKERDYIFPVYEWKDGLARF